MKVHDLPSSYPLSDQLTLLFFIMVLFLKKKLNLLLQPCSFTSMHLFYNSSFKAQSHLFLKVSCESKKGQGLLLAKVLRVDMCMRARACVSVWVVFPGMKCFGGRIPAGHSVNASKATKSWNQQPYTHQLDLFVWWLCPPAFMLTDIESLRCSWFLEYAPQNTHPPLDPSAYGG